MIRELHWGLELQHSGACLGLQAPGTPFKERMPDAVSVVQGACGTCPSSAGTMKMGIERALQVCGRPTTPLMPITKVLQDNAHYRGITSSLPVVGLPWKAPPESNVRSVHGDTLVGVSVSHILLPCRELSAHS